MNCPLTSEVDPKLTSCSALNKWPILQNTQALNALDRWSHQHIEANLLIWTYTHCHASLNKHALRLSASHQSQDLKLELHWQSRTLCTRKSLVLLQSAHRHKQYTLPTYNSTRTIEPYDFDFLITKEGNIDGYTNKQYQDAKHAWWMYLNTRGGGIDNFKHYLRQNIIQNSPVTNDGINQVQKIFCMMSATSKGAPLGVHLRGSVMKP